MMSDVQIENSQAAVWDLVSGSEYATENMNSRCGSSWQAKRATDTAI